MNCDDFQERRFELADGTLSLKERAAAEQHLAHCDACRKALHNEQQFARVLSTSLRRETESLTLRPEIRKNILMAARRKPAPTLMESVIGLWRRFAWPAAIAASVLIVAGLLMSHFLQTPIKKTELVQSSDSAPQAAAAQHPVVAIQMAHRMPALTFRREGNLVIDTLGYETILASETLSPGGQYSQP